MARYSSSFIQISDLYRAYRKAKVDAFYEGSHFHVLAFARYEKSLHQNLRNLLVRINDERRPWFENLSLIGGFGFLPKSIDPPNEEKGDGLHFATLDQFEDWRASCARSSGRVRASFRQVIVPTVDYQLLSALWILKAGHQYDAAIDSKISFGNRLRRTQGSINLDCNGLFAPYFSAYRRWRQKGLDAIRSELERGREIYAVTMDIQRFYHSVSPSFMLRDSFMRIGGIELNKDQKKFTSDLLKSIQSWYEASPDFDARPKGALPVGLSASKVISNVLLIEFDGLIRDQLAPVYYGRYVDDVFLVLRADGAMHDAGAFMKWIASRLGPTVSFRTSEAGPYLKYSPKFAADSRLVFSGNKQKIFHLRGRNGLDLVDQINEQIRKQSSEHRLLPLLPETEGEMLAQALLATPDATLEADALRKADAVSIRRLGFSLLLRDVEAYSRDLKPKEWRTARAVFYGLVERHVLTPRGFFDYFTYISRVFGLIVANGDLSAAESFIDRFERLCELVRSTTTAGTDDRGKFESAIQFYARAFAQVGLQSSTVKGFKFGRRFLSVLRRVRTLGATLPVRVSDSSVRQASRDLLVSDLGRRPYRDYWFRENRIERNAPTVPKQLSINRVLRLDLIRNFRRSLDRGLNPPYWPAVAFATRPFSLAEITAIAPSLLGRESALRNALFALRGARVGRDVPPFTGGGDSGLEVVVPSLRDSAREAVIAVTSFQITDDQWSKAYAGAPDRTLARYKRFKNLLNSILKSAHHADYIVFPELSVPRRWAFGAAIRLAKSNVSLIAGLENNNAGGFYRNDALVSLTTRWPGYRTHIYIVQPKISPAHHELALMRNPKRKLFQPASLNWCRPIYMHGGHAFGVIICSDLTAIANRQFYQGAVDSLFVIEWNPDINTFSYLIEAASHDLHAFVIQTNNRTYGDSRIRAPYVKDFKRDLVRIRGGEEDYFVIAKIDVAGLRSFQKSFNAIAYQKTKAAQQFKPLPIGFSMSAIRKSR